MLNESQLNDIVVILKSRIPTVTSIYLFGSGVEDHFNENSDIDIAFTSDENIPNLTIWEAKNELASTFNRDVDLVDLLNANTVLQIQVVAEGKRIFTKNISRSEQFEARVFEDYITLNEDRAEILQEIAKSKSIYG